MCARKPLQQSLSSDLWQEIQKVDVSSSNVRGFALLVLWHLTQIAGVEQMAHFKQLSSDGGEFGFSLVTKALIRASGHLVSLHVHVLRVVSSKVVCSLLPFDSAFWTNRTILSSGNIR